MSQKTLFLVLLSFIFVSGCISDPTAIARALPEINNFLEENPNADITVVVWSGPDSEFKEVCGTTPGSEPLYYVNMIDGEDRVVAWIEIDSQQLVCLKKFGREIDERDDDRDDDERDDQDDIPEKVVIEEVKCVFENSNSTESCFADDGSGCSGVGSCVVNVDGYLGNTLSWKSSCGSFVCSSVTEPTPLESILCSTTLALLLPLPEPIISDNSAPLYVNNRLLLGP